MGQDMFVNPENLSGDLRWLDDAGCADLDISDFFVDAGHVISEEVLEICRGCPVRLECAEHSYDQNISGGYFAGISPGQRRDMSKEEALDYIRGDLPKNPPKPRNLTPSIIIPNLLVLDDAEETPVETSPAE